MARRQRTYHYVEAARATAQFLPADPVMWLELAARSGMNVYLWNDGLLMDWQHCEDDEHNFLVCWLNLTPGGREAVKQVLRQRADERRAA